MVKLKAMHTSRLAPGISARLGLAKERLVRLPEVNSHAYEAGDFTFKLLTGQQKSHQSAKNNP